MTFTFQESVLTITKAALDDDVELDAELVDPVPDPLVPVPVPDALAPLPVPDEPVLPAAAAELVEPVVVELVLPVTFWPTATLTVETMPLIGAVNVAESRAVCAASTAVWAVVMAVWSTVIWAMRLG